MHTFLLDAYLEQHPDSKLRQPPMDEVQAAAHIIDRQFRAETFRELRHLTETSGRYMPSCYVVRLYDWDTDMGRLQEMRGRLDGPACPDDPQQVQQLRERIWKAENRMVREAERILEGDQEIPLRQTYIENSMPSCRHWDGLHASRSESTTTVLTGSCSTNTGFFPAYHQPSNTGRSRKLSANWTNGSYA